jgi:hypothetical protein
VKHMRRTAIVIAGALTTVFTLMAAAPAAFAMRVIAPEGASGPTPSTLVVTHAGMAGWQIALIAIGAAVVAAALAAIALRARLRRSPTPVAS